MKNWFRWVLFLVVSAGTICSFSALSDWLAVRDIDQELWTQKESPNANEWVYQETYKAVTSEIKERIGYDYSLFIYKFVLFGSVFAFLFGSAWRQGLKGKKFIPDLRTVLGIASVGFLIIDYRLIDNGVLMGTLGSWVRYLESQKGVIGWETFFSTVETIFQYRLIKTAYFPTVVILISYYATVLWGENDESLMKIVNLPIFIIVVSLHGLFTILQQYGWVMITMLSLGAVLSGYLIFSKRGSLWLFQEETRSTSASPGETSETSELPDTPTEPTQKNHKPTSPTQ